MNRLIAVLALLAGLAFALPLIAQESDEEQKSAFLRFVEGQLSTPDRQISINGLDGVLSSDVSIAEITISDGEGVYMRIDDAQLVWNQGALLTGRLQIEQLSAAAVEFIRPPVPAEGFEPPAPEAPSLDIPDLPVAVIIENLSVPSITFGEDVFGLGSEISADGSIVLEDGSLDANLAIQRLDAGGALTADVSYAADTRVLDLDLNLTEPENGVIANLLQIEGRPNIDLSITGAGPVDELDATLTLLANGQQALSGTARIARASDGFGVTIDLGGPIADLIAPPYREFFGETTRIAARANVRDAGGFEISDFALTGGQLRLIASAETANDGFLTRLSLNGEIADPSGDPVTLPVSGQRARLDTATFTVDYGGADGDWSARIAATNIATPELNAETLDFTVSGVASNLQDEAARRLTFNGDGALSGITAPDPAIEEALGDTIGLGLAGLWEAGNPVQIAQLRLAGGAFAADLAGTLSGTLFEGDIAVATPSIAPFSGLAGQNLSGGIDVAATGEVDLLTTSFDLTFDGTATDLELGVAALDGVLQGQTTLSGALARTDAGFAARDFRIGSSAAEITADGRFSSTDADFGFSVNVSDIALLTEDASGALRAAGTARGTDGNIALDFAAEIPTGRLADRNLSEARLEFSGRLAEEALNGNISGTGFVGPHRVSLASDIFVSGETMRLADLAFTAGGTELTGGVTRDGDGLFTGQLDLNATDISTAAALLLAEAEGRANAKIALAPDNGTQMITLNASVDGLATEGVTIDQARIAASISDAFGVPVIDGSLKGSDLTAGGTTINTISATALREGESTQFDATAALATGADVALAGSLSPIEEGFSVALDSASLTGNGVTARLAEPARLRLSGETVDIDPMTLSVGSGTIRVSGSSGARLNLSVVLSSLPLSVANLVSADLALSGTLDGQIDVAGATSAPTASFALSGSGIGAQPLAPLGLTGIGVTASGRYENDSITLSGADITADGGIAANVSGTVALSGTGTDLRLTGTYPLALANSMLGNRGTQIAGTANLDVRVTGALSDPQISGTISTAGADIVDPLSNFRLQDVTATAALTGDAVRIETFSGAIATGGTISASGTVSLSEAAGFPADITLRLNEARYTDNLLFAATASGTLNLTGPVLDSPLLSGDLFIDRAEISIGQIGGPGAELTEVDHAAIPVPVARTLDRAGLTGTGEDGASQSDLRLDISVNAPARIFVRGRGLDAELGGTIRLTGTASNIEPVGGFELIRGRLAILGQRITFTSGRVTLVGDLDPFIRLTASTMADATTVNIEVAGPASDLDVIFSSQPQLPQDEVLSLLIFGRGMNDLSPLQLAKLAGAAAQLAGDSNPGLVDGLRGAAGLDDLDIVTDETGNAAVTAGTYIQDNVYVSVEAGTGGNSRVNIDLDLGSGVTARGSAGTSGETSVGVFYETDF